MREILVATSDGKIVHDVQPLLRFGVRAIAEHDGKRQEGSSGGGGRMTHRLLRRQVARSGTPREAARQAIAMLDAREAPAGRDGGRARARRQRHPPARSGRATGSRPTSTARARATTPARSATPSRASSAPWSTTRRCFSRAARSTSTTRATSRARSVLIENGMLVGLHARSALSAKHFKLDADRQRPARELRLRTPCRA